MRITSLSFPISLDLTHIFTSIISTCDDVSREMQAIQICIVTGPIKLSQTQRRRAARLLEI